VLRLTLTGATGLPSNLGTMSREDRLAMANQRNQSYVIAHRDDAMETLVSDVTAARQETLQLLDQFTDEQLAALVSASLMAGRIAGDLFAANAQHAAARLGIGRHCGQVGGNVIPDTLEIGEELRSGRNIE
jgi:hypothetical protein